MEWFFLALIAAFAFGLGDVARKRALVNEHSHQFLASFYIAYFILVLFLLPRVSFDLAPWQFALIFIKAVFLLIAMNALMHLLKHNDVSEIIPLKNVSLFFLLIFSFFLLRETPTIANILGIVVLFFGTYLLEADHKVKNLVKPLALLHSPKVILFIVYGTFISLSALIDKFIAPTIGLFTYLFFVITFLMVNSLVVQIMKYDGLRDVRNAFKKDWILLFIVAALFLVADLFYLTSVRVPGALIVLVIPIIRLSTLISTFIGGRMFHEKRIGMKLFAGAVMVIGAVLVMQ